MTSINTSSNYVDTGNQVSSEKRINRAADDPIKEALEQLDFSNADSEGNLTNLDALQQQVTERRTELGATNNRIDSSIEQLANEEQQTLSARSRVEDADIAELVSQRVIEQVKQQVQTAVQGQANVSAEDTLRLLS